MPAFGYSPEDLREWDRTGIDPHAQPAVFHCAACKRPCDAADPELRCPWCRLRLCTSCCIARKCCKAPPTYQPDLFRPMCGQSIAAQTVLFDTTPDSSGPRVPDLPGQQTMF